MAAVACAVTPRPRRTVPSGGAAVGVARMRGGDAGRRDATRGGLAAPAVGVSVEAGAPPRGERPQGLVGVGGGKGVVKWGTSHRLRLCGLFFRGRAGGRYCNICA